MNKEDVLRMAKEATGNFDRSERSMLFFGLNGDQMFRFADLVAAHEREAIIKFAEDDRYSHQHVHTFVNYIKARSSK